MFNKTIAQLVDEFGQANKVKREVEAVEKDLKTKLKAQMKGLSAYGEKFTVTLIKQAIRRVDQSKIPNDILEKARVSTIQTKLMVSAK